VAGMLRSFDYAAASALRARENAPPTVAARARRWREDARAAFLAGYRDRASPAFLPRSEAGFRGLLALFELEKVLYEVAYEIDNRPGWLSIPIAGLASVLDGLRGRDGDA
jgi:predicted trehalose synthase